MYDFFEYNSTKKVGAPWKYVDFTPFERSEVAELRNILGAQK